MKKILTCLFAILLIVTAAGKNIHADDSYEVVVDGGLYGKVDGNDYLSLDCKYGDRITIDSAAAVLSDGTLVYSGMVTDAGGAKKSDFEIRIAPENAKYYLKGLHVSGHDDNLSSHRVDRDLTFVSGFGSKSKNQVEYHVYYINAETGETLLEDGAEYLVLYGNPGSQPVVAYKYFEGYQPNAYQQTGTLPSLEEDKLVEFVFEYVPIEAGEPEREDIYDETYVYEEGPAGGGGAGGGGGGGAAPVTPPEEIINIDEPDVPQTNPEPSPEPTPTPTPEPEPINPEPVPQSFWETLISHPWLLAGTVGGTALLLAFLYLLFGKRRENA